MRFGLLFLIMTTMAPIGLAMEATFEGPISIQWARGFKVGRASHTRPEGYPEGKPLGDPIFSPTQNNRIGSRDQSMSWNMKLVTL